MVWPALLPPWKRTTMSARLDSQSTILPLPSSPHWAPITVTLAISSSDRSEFYGRAVAQDMRAPQSRRVVGIRQSGNGNPVLGAQLRRRRRIGAERQEDA